MPGHHKGWSQLFHQESRPLVPHRKIPLASPLQLKILSILLSDRTLGPVVKKQDVRRFSGEKMLDVRFAEIRVCLIGYLAEAVQRWQRSLKLSGIEDP